MEKLEFRRIRVLFVCAANYGRSPTGEDLLRPLEHYEVKSCGVIRGAVNEVTQDLVDWADIIIVMEDYMKEHLQKYTNPHKIKVLNIPDRYAYADKALIKLLAERLLLHGIDATRVVDSFKPTRTVWKWDERIYADLNWGFDGKWR